MVETTAVSQPTAKSGAAWSGRHMIHKNKLFLVIVGCAIASAALMIALRDFFPQSGSFSRTQLRRHHHAARMMADDDKGAAAFHDMIAEEERSLDNTQQHSASVADQREAAKTRKIVRQAPASISACLLFMDDNNRLAEWIAYHYFAWNLRTLVIAVDPNSKSSPSEILNRWREEANMTIVEWSDNDFTQENLKRAHEIKGRRYNQTDVHKMQAWVVHHSRQETFYKSCASYMYQNKQGWTTFHDVDEYLVMNQGLLKQSGFQPLGQKLSRTPGGTLKLAVALPHLIAASAVIDQNSTLASWSDHYSGPCITFPRKYFSAVEAKPEQVAREVPKPFDPMRFDTLRFMYQAKPQEINKDMMGKSVLDVSQIEKRDLLGHYKVHRLMPKCPSANVQYDISPIRIQHYLGSWEAFSQRDDPRGVYFRRVKFDSRANDSRHGWCDDIRPWITGFVNLVGQEKAERLLESTGVIPNLAANSSKENTTAHASREATLSA